jgi:hypothetical protein
MFKYILILHWNLEIFIPIGKLKTKTKSGLRRKTIYLTNTFTYVSRYTSKHRPYTF